MNEVEIAWKTWAELVLKREGKIVISEGSEIERDVEFQVTMQEDWGSNNKTKIEISMLDKLFDLMYVIFPLSRAETTEMVDSSISAVFNANTEPRAHENISYTRIKWISTKILIKCIEVHSISIETRQHHVRSWPNISYLITQHYKELCIVCNYVMCSHFM